MRRLTKKVMVGSVQIGGGAPISIQSMTNTDTADYMATLAQIERLEEAGCQIVRLAVRDMDGIEGFSRIRKHCDLPMVADIHFDHRLAIAAIDAGADKVRINPGNIGSDEKVAAVLDKAKAARIPIRIGVNGGSLEKDIVKKYGGVTAEGICESAVKAVSYAESFGFDDIVVALKSSDVQMNYDSYKSYSAASDRPLHIGLTESGSGEMGEIKSCAALGALLLEGIGDTMRISLTGDPVREVVLAKKLLLATGIRKAGIDFVSCPTCGRTRVDLPSIAAKVEEGLAQTSKRLEEEGRFIRVAVMGCEVNGPGEASHADAGVACGKGVGLLIRKGEIVKKVPEAEIVPELQKLIMSIV